ncbi:hypothetical protein JW758_04950 [Candidatus Peregrinibacteria bacterium]|nr:hypothetical protein [Candidatus Peregrinibacteria bacterium]
MKFFLAIVLAFVIVDVVIVFYVVYKRSRKKLSKQIKDEICDSWKQIIRQSDKSHAIMNADKLLDHTLTQLGYKGSLGAKLKKSPRLFKDINSVWRAHKVRNNIAHQMNYKVTEKAYKDSMLAFKQAFKDLKIF